MYIYIYNILNVRVRVRVGVCVGVWVRTFWIFFYLIITVCNKMWQVFF